MRLPFTNSPRFSFCSLVLRYHSTGPLSDPLWRSSPDRSFPPLPRESFFGSLYSEWSLFVSLHSTPVVKRNFTSNFFYYVCFLQVTGECPKCFQRFHQIIGDQCLRPSLRVFNSFKGWWCDYFHRLVSVFYYIR